jgi:hypothetical protein
MKEAAEERQTKRAEEKTNSKLILLQLIISQLVKKFPIFYGTRRFITAFTTASHMFLI